MIVSDGYTAEYYRKRNEIIIRLPQTLDTLTSTAEPVSDRKRNITDEQLAVILTVVKKMMEVEHEGDM